MQGPMAFSVSLMMFVGKLKKKFVMVGAGYQQRTCFLAKETPSTIHAEMFARV
jgi:hypothetical protein